MSVVNLRAFGQAVSGYVSAAPISVDPQIGVDYVPPFNARPEVLVTLAPFPHAIAGDLPANFDWRNASDRQARFGSPTEPLVAAPANQYACGSCWAVASASCLTDRFSVALRRRTPDLSATAILACLPGNHGCNGGFPHMAALYFETTGIPPASCARYTDWCTGLCTTGAPMSLVQTMVPTCTDCCETCERSQAQVASTQALPDPDSMKASLFKDGPIVATFRVFADWVAGFTPQKYLPGANHWAATNHIYINSADADLYGPQMMDCPSKGRIKASRCPMGWHAVVVVGWGVDDHVNVKNAAGETELHSVPFWIIRNSYGSDWGDEGYFRMAISNVDRGWNVETALDVPTQVGDKQYGGSTIFLPATGVTSSMTSSVTSSVRPSPDKASAQLKVTYRSSWDLHF